MVSPDHLEIGVDVGGRSKGFHVAGIEGGRRVELARFRGEDSVAQAVAWMASRRPLCIAVDSPAAWAPEGQGSRPCERAFARAGICGIRFTPDQRTATARADRYYEWIEQGLELWNRLRPLRMPVIECFPTASWTQWIGRRGARTRALWTREGLSRLVGAGLLGCENVRSQDDRDAVAAALTALQYADQPTDVEAFGPLIVPIRDSAPLAAGSGRW